MSKLTQFLLVVIAVAIQVQFAWADNSSKNSLRHPMERTPMSEVELLSALREGHVKVFGAQPSKNRLAMAWGQVAFENGRGKLTFNHNLGNVSAGKNDQHTYYNTNDKHVYRHFETSIEGAEAYWIILKKCNAALVKFDSGNPVDAAVSLKRCRYFEANLTSYTSGLKSLYKSALNKVFLEEKRERREKAGATESCTSTRAAVCINYSY